MSFVFHVERFRIQGNCARLLPTFPVTLRPDCFSNQLASQKAIVAIISTRGSSNLWNSPMHLPNLDGMALAQQLAARNRTDGTHYVFDELATGLRICGLLRLHEVPFEERREWNIARAVIALEVAEASMWQLKMSHPDFNQMMALAERLKFEIEDLSVNLDAP
jgi:hypothetical protein